MAKSIQVRATRPRFRPLRPHEMSDGQVQFRKVLVPEHRRKSIKKAWLQDPPNKHDIYPLVHDIMKIDIRMNLKRLQVELKTRPDTPDISNLQRCQEFLNAYMLGFDAKDASAFLVSDNVCMEGFAIDEVKTLRGEHLSRAIGRLCGKGGKTKFAIENATKTRIVIADKRINIMGTPEDTKVAKNVVCRLIMGSPAGKINSILRAVSGRLEERRGLGIFRLA